MFGKSFVDLIARVEELEKKVLALTEPLPPAPEEEAWVKGKGKGKSKDDY